MCAYCGAVQPPQLDEDFFAVLGVPRRYQQDLAQAETRFRELSRQVHPDRFARADPQARRASLQRTVQLNEAWKTVRDPVRRAEYLLGLAGTHIGDEARTGGAVGPGPAPGQGKGKVLVPPALLAEVLELREELADARAEGDDVRVQGMAAAVRDRVAAALSRVAGELERAERVEAERAQALAAAAGDLIAIRYFRRFLEEVDVHDEAVATAAEAGEALPHA
jgi:molecular chaperone HscB